ncbi:hypothetical protein L1887_44280 [Cichorium endivia]|nr:hypothetical protein L1887_44280 [Cichorium endivia]
MFIEITLSKLVCSLKNKSSSGTSLPHFLPHTNHMLQSIITLNHIQKPNYLRSLFTSSSSFHDSCSQCQSLLIIAVILISRKPGKQ